MKKRMVVMMMCAALAAEMLAGCGSSETAEETNETAEEESEEALEEEEESEETTTTSYSEDEIVTIYWQYPYDTDVTDTFYLVEDAVNEIMEAEIGVHVTFVPTGLTASQQDATLAVSSGEQLDIMFTYGTGVGNLVDDGLIMPLDDIVEEYGQDILEACGTSVDGCYYDGLLYGVPCTAGSVSSTYGYVMKKAYADKYGFEADDDRVYSMEEIEEMFAIVKEGEGEDFYMMTPWMNTYEPLNYSYQEYDMLSGSFSGGVLMLNRDFSDLTIYNYFETEEYEEFCEMMYRWAQEGYIVSDAAIDSEWAARPAQDNYLGNFGFCYPESSMNDCATSWGEEVVQFRTVDGFIALNGGCSAQWNIPITSAYPEKAMQAINLVIENFELATLIQYGFEGEEYNVVDEDEEGHIVIEYTSDDLWTLPYYNYYGLWGNRFEIAQVYPQDFEYVTALQEYDENISEDRISAAMGYNFVTSDVSSEIAAVETVMEQYCYSFNAGAVDPETELPKFISALKDAGIDDIIAENQSQLDAWAAAQ